MTRWLFLALVCVLPGGSVLLALEWWRRRREAEREPNLVPRWAAFIANQPVIVNGEPRLLQAQLPDVRPLKAKKNTTASADILRRVK